MKLSIIIPVYNEESTLSRILEKVKKADIKNIKKEIIIINDGSTDQTKEILKNLKERSIKVIQHTKNRGKGAAIRTALNHVTGDIVIVQDADLEYNPKDFYKLIKPIIKKNTEVVYGSRFKDQKFISIQRWTNPIHYIGNKILSLTFFLLYFKYISDIETCYKCFTKRAIKKIELKENDFRIEPEITTQLLKHNFKILEVPINYKYRTYEEGKKITWKDGILAFLSLFKYRYMTY